MDGAEEHFGGNVHLGLAGVIIAIFLCASVCLASSGQKDLSFLTSEEQAWFREHPVLRLGTDQIFSPVEQQDILGYYHGIAGDYVSIVQEKLGIRFKLVPYQNRTELLNALRLHEIDVVAALVKTPERSKYILFTDDYVRLPVVIIARQNVDQPLTLEKLNGMRVSVIQGHAIQTYVEKNYPGIKVDPVETPDVALKKVSFGLDDAFLGIISTSSYYISQTQITNLRVAGETPFVYEICFGIRNDWPILRSILDKTLKRISPEERRIIFERYIHLMPPPIISNKQIWVGILIGLFVVGVLLGGFFAWTMSLKRMVRRRTAELDHELAERRRAEEEVRKLNDELESRVMARTAELSVANRELESFSYSVSHDLRSPLRTLDGFSQILLETYSSKIDEKGQDYLRRIRAASQRMSQLIDDLLQLARVTRNHMSRHEVDLSQMVTAISCEIQKNYPAHSVDMVVEPGLEVQADEVLLDAVIRNLLENAWKFTARTPHPKVEFGSEMIDGKRTFYVRDNGIGFDMAYVNKLFKPFQRLHAAAEFQGSGIGLATVQRIVNRHGGRIWAKGEPGKGATFYFTLD